MRPIFLFAVVYCFMVLACSASMDFTDVPTVHDSYSLAVSIPGAWIGDDGVDDLPASEAHDGEDEAGLQDGIEQTMSTVSGALSQGGSVFFVIQHISLEEDRAETATAPSLSRIPEQSRIPIRKSSLMTKTKAFKFPSSTPTPYGSGLPTPTRGRRISSQASEYSIPKKAQAPNELGDETSSTTVRLISRPKAFETPIAPIRRMLPSARKLSSTRSCSTPASVMARRPSYPTAEGNPGTSMTIKNKLHARVDHRRYLSEPIPLHFGNTKVDINTPESEVFKSRDKIPRESPPTSPFTPPITPTPSRNFHSVSVSGVESAMASMKNIEYYTRFGHRRHVSEPMRSSSKYTEIDLSMDESEVFKSRHRLSRDTSPILPLTPPATILSPSIHILDMAPMTLASTRADQGDNAQVEYDQDIKIKSENDFTVGEVENPFLGAADNEQEVQSDDGIQMLKKAWLRQPKRMSW